MIKDKNIFIMIDKSKICRKEYINILVSDIDLPEKTCMVQNSIVKAVNQGWPTF